MVTMIIQLNVSCRPNMQGVLNSMVLGIIGSNLLLLEFIGDGLRVKTSPILHSLSTSLVEISM